VSPENLRNLHCDRSPYRPICSVAVADPDVLQVSGVLTEGDGRGRLAR
jgi:hypothetical protein